MSIRRDVFIFLGFGALVVIAPFAFLVFNATLGPSSNHIMECKGLKDQGYLHDDCFYEDGMLKGRGCKK